ncbi:MAG TPA: outer membrane beta-barrel protein [Bacteroidia bacterium]|nr:outer membrane beta-barrel protein [Bacteroidia bacterium]
MIKKQLFIALLLISIQSFAQYNKGQLMVNGNINGSSNKGKGTHNDISNHTNKFKSQQFGCDLNVGYFLANRFAIGIEEQIRFSKAYSEIVDITYRNTNMNRSKYNFTGVFMRYNQPIYKSKFGVFFKLTNGYAIQKQTTETASYSDSFGDKSSKSERKGSGYYGYLTPGLFYFVNNRLSLEATLGDLSYSKSNSKDQTDYKYKNSYVNANFSVSNIWLGVTFYLGKNKNAANESSAAETK